MSAKVLQYIAETGVLTGALNAFFSGAGVGGESCTDGGAAVCGVGGV